jgi:putative Holliday junction resolvase
MGRVLGIDFGDRRSGVALSDPGGVVALPRGTVEGEKALCDAVAGLVRDEGVELVVVGLPRNMDGSVGRKAEGVLAFVERLRARLGDVPIETWDERLTTVQAERELRSGGVGFHGRRERIDRVAAQILLQSYLDARRAREGRAED